MVSSAVNDLLNEILTPVSQAPTSPQAEVSHTEESSDFVPREPESLAAARITEPQVETLILKYLLNCHTATGRQISEQIRLPLNLIFDVLRNMKSDQLIVYRKSAGPNDYEHELTTTGHERAQRYFEQRAYYGSAPVSLEEYRQSIAAQSMRNKMPKGDDLKKALSGLRISDEIFSQLGQAISSVGAIFLYGSPGNGKTSIAERLTDAFGDSIWIPRTIDIDGDYVSLFDPMVHKIVSEQEQVSKETGVDRRWIRIQRPTVIAGGELTLEHLEFRSNRSSGTVEAPLHLKSNCGTLLIDDFGRQRVSTTELLNRWIVPLEKHYDFLMTPAGKKIRVPFEQLIVFATNLEPQHLVDEAFLRRIPYKVEVKDPTEQEFRALFQSLCPEHGFEHRPEAIEYLIAQHYHAKDRPFRFCHVRDFLLQIANRCRFHELPMELTTDAIDAVALNYFGNLSGLVTGTLARGCSAP